MMHEVGSVDDHSLGNDIRNRVRLLRGWLREKHWRGDEGILAGYLRDLATGGLASITASTPEMHGLKLLLVLTGTSAISRSSSRKNLGEQERDGWMAQSSRCRRCVTD